MSLVRQIRRGVDALIHGRSADRDIEDEVRQYLDEATRAQERNGLARADAARAALLEMGNATCTSEQIRGVGWEHGIQTLLGDVQYAVRRLRRSPAFAFTAIVTLALGIGASTAVFSALDPVLLEPLPFPHASELVTIDDHTDGGGLMPVTFGTFDEVRARSRAFDAIAVADDWQPSISGSGDPERLKGRRITASYLSVYGVSPAVGRGFTRDDENPGGARVAVISDALAARRFAGDASVVGRTIDLDGDPYTVVGIMPRTFTDVMAPVAELWAPLRDRPTAILSAREWGHHYKMVGRLAPTATISSATRDLLAIGRNPIGAFARPPWANLAKGLVVRPMPDDITGPVRPAFYAIVGAVLLLLAIAIVNVTNLLLARGAQRRPELAMRVALGAGRGRLVRQLVTESVVLAVFGGALGLLFARIGVQALVSVSPPGLPRVDSVRIDGRVFLFALLLTAIVGVVVGLMPSLGAVRAETSQGIHHAARSNTGSRTHTRNVLVMAEVALAVVLLIGAGLLLQSVRRLLTVPPGFEPSGVVTMQVVASGHGYDADAARLELFRQELEAVRRVPGVEHAGWTSQLPLSGDVDGYGYEAQSRSELSNGKAGSALRYAVTPGYFAAMGVPLRHGRLIQDADRAGTPEAIVINESMARRLFGSRNPIGQRIRFGPELEARANWDYVVGVVGDVKHYSLAADAPEAFYIASGQWGWVDRVQTLVVRASGDAVTLVPALKQAVWSIDRNQPVQRVRTMEAFIAASAGQRRFAMLVIETFAVVAFVLASVGLYGVIAGGVIERIREIGIRSALGAAPSDIVGAVVGRAVRLAATGAAMGVIASLTATRLIRPMLFGISNADVTTYAVVLLGLLMTAALAAWAPARRAAGVDPTLALRSD